MSVVPLVSGGLDSTVMAALIKLEGIDQYPLFINYGQLSYAREYEACCRLFSDHGLPAATIIDVSGWGKTISSGLTDSRKRIFEDAFLPGRNLMFLLIAASYAYRVNASSIAIGLLDESQSLFPDQTRAFCSEAESILGRVLDRSIRVIAPLIAMAKADVLRIATELGISGTYSCHAGTVEPCGACVACREYLGIEV